MEQVDFFELSFVSRVLGARSEQIRQVCRVLGIAPDEREGETLLCRDAVRAIYRHLYPPYIPPEAA